MLQFVRIFVLVFLTSIASILHLQVVWLSKAWLFIVFILLGVRSLANASRARQFNPLNPPGVGWVPLPQTNMAAVVGRAWSCMVVRGRACVVGHACSCVVVHGRAWSVVCSRAWSCAVVRAWSVIRGRARSVVRGSAVLPWHERTNNI